MFVGENEHAISHSLLGLKNMQIRRSVLMRGDIPTDPTSIINSAPVHLIYVVFVNA